MKNLVLSPHYDDAVLSCGGMIKLKGKETSVITVFAGRYDGLTAWDKTCGLNAIQNPPEIRRAEDKNALLSLGCGSYGYLDYFEEDAIPLIKDAEILKKYGSEADLKEDLYAVINKSGAENIYFPLGIKNKDHIRIRNAALILIKNNRLGDKRCFFYEDFPYTADKNEYSKALEEIRENFILEQSAMNIKPVLKDKISAILKYKTQIKSIFGTDKARQVEKSILSVQNKINYFIYLFSGIVLKSKEQYWLIKNK
jgi:LmbE family N-acetylglucosaminyl deacetylase